MRPAGFTEARTERDDALTPLDSRLQQAWERFSRHDISYEPWYWENHLKEIAERMLDSSISVREVERFILYHAPSHNCERFSAFITAAYQRSDQATIVYPLHTPEIDALGMYLRDKHLIIEGEVGRNVGAYMIGSLTINGIAGPRAGHRMHGSLYANVAVDAPGLDMLGKKVLRSLSGESDTVWTVPEHLRTSFLEETRERVQEWHHSTPLQRSDQERTYRVSA
jgi:hypothetical protein